MKINITEKEIKSKKKIIAFEIDYVWYELLKATADDEMISVSNLIRKILYQYCLKDKIAKLNNEKESN